MIRRLLWGAAAMLGVVCASALQQASAAATGTPHPVPPATLADTGLHRAGDPAAVRPTNRPFSPQYPLWSDGLSKRRWVSLPEGASVDASDAFDWKFPVGTRFWKEFSLRGRPVETRLVWKATANEWVYAAYVWNAEGTEAVLAPEDGVPQVVDVAPGRRHSIPSRTDCAACHGSPSAGGPLGFTALQLSPDRDPNALHAESLRPGMVTLADLVREGRLAPAREEFLSSPPRIRSERAATRAALGYLVGNCASCHNGRGEIAAMGPTLRIADLVADGDAVARSLVAQRTRWQLPGVTDESTVLVHPAAPDASALLFRMRSRSPSSQMPPLGTVVRDQQAVDAIANWIASELRGR